MITDRDIEKLKTVFATKADLDNMEKRMDKKYVTKADLKDLSTKDDLKKYATKDDLKSLSTKDDLKKYVIKDDLKDLSTKDDLKKYAIKDDLKDLSTKDDLKKYATQEYMDKRFKDIEYELKTTRNLLGLKIDLLDNKVTKIDSKFRQYKDTSLTLLDGIAGRVKELDEEHTGITFRQDQIISNLENQESRIKICEEKHV